MYDNDIVKSIERLKRDSNVVANFMSDIMIRNLSKNRDIELEISKLSRRSLQVTPRRVIYIGIIQNMLKIIGIGELIRSTAIIIFLNKFF